MFSLQTASMYTKKPKEMRSKLMIYGQVYYIKVILLPHWKTVHRQHWYRCVQWDPLYKSMHQTHEV